MHVLYFCIQLWYWDGFVISSQLMMFFMPEQLSICSCLFYLQLYKKKKSNFVSFVIPYITIQSIVYL